MTLAELLDLINKKILSGGNRTTAVNLKAVESEIATSSINKTDAGLVVENLLGYKTELTPTDLKHFITLKYFLDNLPDIDFAPYLKKDGSVPMNGSLDLDNHNIVNIDSLVDSSANPIITHLRKLYDINGLLVSNFQDRTTGFGITSNDKIASLKTDLLFSSSETFQMPPTGGTLSKASDITDLKGGVPSAGDTLNKLYNLIVGIGQFAGGHDASGGTLPTTGTGASGAIDKSDFWKVTVAGTIPGLGVLKPGDVIYASIANASVAADFFAVENNQDQATSSVLGLVKLYTDLLASNADGSVTQSVLVTEFAKYLDKTITRSANSVLAGPSSGSAAAPTFRALVNADLPSSTRIKLDEIGVVLTEPWANLSNWATVGTPTASVSGGNLTIAGSTSLSTNYIKCSSYGKTNAEYALHEWTINVSTIGAGASGKPFGIQGQSSAAPNAIQVNLELSSTNTGKVKWFADNNSTAIQTSDGTLSGIASGDVITCKLYRFPNRYVFIAIHTSGKTVTDTLYLFTPRTSLVGLNPVLAGQLAFYNQGGNHTIGPFRYSILDLKTPGLLVIGDSITQSGGSSNRYLSKIQERYEVVAEGNAQPSAVCGDINVSEIALYTPTNMLVFIGTNDVAFNGVSAAQTAYASLVTALGGIGYSVANGNLKFATLLPRGSSNYDTFNSWIVSTYGAANVLDLNAVVSDGTVNFPTKYTADTVHPNQYATTLLADRIAEDYRYKRREFFYSPNLFVYSSPFNGYVGLGINGSGRYGLDVTDINKNTVLRAGNTSSDNGVYTIHDNANNISFVAHGAIYESGVWTAKATTAVIYGQSSSGVFGIYTNNGLTPGSTFAPTIRFTIGPSGGLNITKSVTPAGTTGAQTINLPNGTVNIAAGQISIVVTNSLITTNTNIFPVIRTNDTTAQIKNVVPAAGSFTINLVSAATAETSIGFLVIN